MATLDERNSNEIARKTNNQGEHYGNTQSFLKEQIGKIMRVEFLIGSNMLKERVGVLEEIGNNYILLRALESETVIYCDMNSIKFINIPTNGFSNQMNMGQMNNRYPYY